MHMSHFWGVSLNCSVGSASLSFSSNQQQRPSGEEALSLGARQQFLVCSKYTTPAAASACHRSLQHYIPREQVLRTAQDCRLVLAMLLLVRQSRAEMCKTSSIADCTLSFVCSAPFQ